MKCKQTTWKEKKRWISISGPQRGSKTYVEDAIEKQCKQPNGRMREKWDAVFKISTGGGDEREWIRRRECETLREEMETKQRHNGAYSCHLYNKCRDVMCPYKGKGNCE